MIDGLQCVEDGGTEAAVIPGEPAEQDDAFLVRD
jgi:hypothetical protein